MRTNSIAIVTAAVVAGVVVGSATSAPAQADDSQTPGVVHIRDATPVHNMTGQPGSRKTIVSPAHYEHTSYSRCASGSCGYGGCGITARQHFGRHRHLDDLLQLDRLTQHSADHGWGRPVKRPIERVPVLYQRYWPPAWDGQGGGGDGGANKPYYPMIYMPTDTAQMGYYYQRVPFWRPNPAMTPPVPWPGHWHQRECGARPAGHNFSQAVLPHWSSSSYPVLHHGGGVEPARRQPQPEDQPQVPPAPPKDLNQSAQNFIP